ncbi:hypothetical protein F5X68DRAFT_227483 [Plectosphaerella plurivora]|uniref:Rhodopsin domain-containing protein n=1 Tax=Plectosphaerella plurivora TaxID=936078 RepID=A0A9P9AHI8_9PEZI|nr:hypothetical protein F5X68DRAFT_227483 [Plectosphaerella plurivora]
MQEQLGVARVQASVCNLPHQDSGREVLVIIFVMAAVAYLAIGLRIFSMWLNRDVNYDDCLILVAAVASVLPFVCVGLMVKEGFGIHLWDLEDGALLKILRLLYLTESVYILVLGLIKPSIVALYIRVFGKNATFKAVALVVQLLIGMLTFIHTALTIFTCWPIQKFWDFDIKQGRCLSISQLALANSGMSCGLDLIIILLPISMLYRLHMSRSRKLILSVVFCIGGVGLVATGLRIQSLAVYGNSLDPTVDYIPLFYWTTAELAGGALCACLPAIRVLVLSTWSKVGGSISRSRKANVSTDPHLSPSGAPNFSENKVSPLTHPVNKNGSDNTIALVTSNTVGRESRTVSAIV